MLPEKTPTRPFVIDVPILEDEAVEALHTFLLDLLNAFETEYFSQLHRYEQYVEKARREALENNPYLETDPNVQIDEELNDELPF